MKIALVFAIALLIGVAVASKNSDEKNAHIGKQK